MPSGQILQGNDLILTETLSWRLCKSTTQGTGNYPSIYEGRKPLDQEACSIPIRLSKVSLEGLIVFQSAERNRAASQTRLTGKKDLTHTNPRKVE